jgi:hypothetical protein
MPDNRPITEVLQEILRNLQEMVRSEIRLAKAEARGEVAHIAKSGLWIAAGAVVAVCAAVFLAWSAAYALATVMTMWAAALVVALVLAVIAAVLLAVGARLARRIQPVPERTMETLRENLEWMKHSVK